MAPGGNSRTSPQNRQVTLTAAARAGMVHHKNFLAGRASIRSIGIRQIVDPQVKHRTFPSIGVLGFGVGGISPSRNIRWGGGGGGA